MLNHTIFNKKNQCHHRNNQLLLYIRRKKGVGKSKIVKTIYLGFGFLKRQKELLIATPIRAAIANIGNVTIHRVLNINDCIQK